jgi:hypothetical protein
VDAHNGECFLVEDTSASDPVVFEQETTGRCSCIFWVTTSSSCWHGMLGSASFLSSRIPHAYYWSIEGIHHTYARTTFNVLD